MIFRLKTSKRTQEIFQELENRTNYKPYTLVKHAIAWSLKEKTSVEDHVSDSDGLDLNRQTITGDNETFFKVLIEEVEGRYLSEEAKKAVDLLKTSGAAYQDIYTLTVHGADRTAVKMSGK